MYTGYVYIYGSQVNYISTIVFLSRQNASNDTHDDPNGPALQLDPGVDQDHHITMSSIICGVSPPKRAVLHECYQFSEKLFYTVA